VLNRVKEKQPDLALIDAVMPGTDGYQICQSLKKDPQFKDLPVIMLAGAHENVDRQRGESIVGANAILDKPATSQVIIAKVKELLEPQQQTQPAEVVQEEPSFVEEEYEFDDDSEEVDLAVESELLDEEAEWEEPDEGIEEFPDEIEAIEEIEEFDEIDTSDVFEETAPEIQESPAPQETAPAPASAAPQPVAVSDAQLDAVAEEIAKRVAAKLGPVLLQSLTAHVLQLPSIKQVMADTSKRLIQEVLPDIQDSFK
jgi:chemotaxis response regulator CheB